jgi:Putative transposase
MVAAIQTHGELLRWHPHVHTLVTCGGFTPQGEFLELPELDMERLHAEVIEKTLRHCGLWRDSSPRPPPGEEGLVYVAEDDEGEQAYCDGPEELAFVTDPDWDCQPPSDDVPWEVTSDACGDSSGGSKKRSEQLLKSPGAFFAPRAVSCYFPSSSIARKPSDQTSESSDWKRVYRFTL